MDNYYIIYYNINKNFFIYYTVYQIIISSLLFNLIGWCNSPSSEDLMEPILEFESGVLMPFSSCKCGSTLFSNSKNLSTSSILMPFVSGNKNKTINDIINVNPPNIMNVVPFNVSIITGQRNVNTKLPNHPNVMQMANPFTFTRDGNISFV